MLKDGSVDLAFIQNDIAYYAVNGSEMFKDNKVAGLRGLAALYPETIQFVTTADSADQIHCGSERQESCCRCGRLRCGSKCPPDFSRLRYYL